MALNQASFLLSERLQPVATYYSYYFSPSKLEGYLQYVYRLTCYNKVGTGTESS
jgi:hypothetical protein